MNAPDAPGISHERLMLTLAAISRQIGERQRLDNAQASASAQR
jgi:hypothetical protein